MFSKLKEEQIEHSKIKTIEPKTLKYNNILKHIQ